MPRIFSQLLVGGILFSAALSCINLSQPTFAAPPPATAATPKLERPIGIITLGDVFTELIPAGVSLPHSHSETFSTATDQQASLQINVSQKSKEGTEKILTATFDKLPAKPRGKLQLVVTITVDEKKQMIIKATEAETGYTRELQSVAVR